MEGKIVNKDYENITIEDMLGENSLIQNEKLEGKLLVFFRLADYFNGVGADLGVFKDEGEYLKWAKEDLYPFMSHMNEKEYEFKGKVVESDFEDGTFFYKVLATGSDRDILDFIITDTNMELEAEEVYERYELEDKIELFQELIEERYF